MKYQKLGKTDLNASVVAMGAWGIGGGTVWPDMALGVKDVENLLDAAIDLGVNYIDTARGYTVSEEYLGAALEGRRDKFILATKSMSRDAASMAADVETSLRNLRTDHIDLYQVHNPSLSELEQVTAPGGALEALLAAKAAGKSVGLRINPECSTQEGHAIYDPCAPGSRLGTTRAQWDAAVQADPALPGLLDGLHFHTLCEQDSDALALTLAAVEDRFGDLLPRMQWLNFGGGHHITRPGYDLPTLERCITETQTKYGVQVYLEPGEAWALNAGYLITTVLDTLRNGDTSLAILDLSAACHTPDVIEMPYRPPLLNAGDPGERAVTFRLGGPTCLAGDVIGDYSFDAPLTEGDRLLFGDMAIYTTCKNNTFNGMPLPPIWAMDENGTCRELVKFGYSDFKMRLGRAAD